MNFSYVSYENLLKTLTDYGYNTIFYDECYNKGRKAIIRHDIDYCLEKSIHIGEIEKSLNVKSTYFLLLSSDFYNVFSAKGQQIIDSLHNMGHEIGLHFDEARYPECVGNVEAVKEKIIKEADIMTKAVGRSITKVSMHRPSREIIDSDLKIPGIINTYGSFFIRDYKYISDSRRKWKEPIEAYIRNGEYEKFQILVHPFWYGETELSIKEAINSFVSRASLERYDELNSNFTSLNEVVAREEYLHRG